MNCWETHGSDQQESKPVEGCEELLWRSWKAVSGQGRVYSVNEQARSAGTAEHFSYRPYGAGS